VRILGLFVSFSVGVATLVWADPVASSSAGTFGSAAAPLKAPTTATVTVSFSPSNPVGDVYIVEQKQIPVIANGAVTWIQVASGKASPVIFRLVNPVVGKVYTFRVTAQLNTVPIVLSAPSDEVSCTYKPNKPGNPKATIL
jgi:hypothetical protein